MSSRVAQEAAPHPPDRTRTNELWPHGDILTCTWRTVEDPLKRLQHTARSRRPVGDEIRQSASFARAGLVRRLALLRRKKVEGYQYGLAHPDALGHERAEDSLRASFRSPPRHRSAPRRQIAADRLEA